MSRHTESALCIFDRPPDRLIVLPDVDLSEPSCVVQHAANGTAMLTSYRS